jgi:hypothetical protein
MSSTLSSALSSSLGGPATRERARALRWAHLDDAQAHDRAQAFRAAHAADLVALEALYIDAAERTSDAGLIAAALVGAAIQGDVEVLSEFGLPIDHNGAVSDAELVAAMAAALA